MQMNLKIYLVYLLDFFIGVGLTISLIYSPLFLFSPLSGIPSIIGFACVLVLLIYFIRTRQSIAAGIAVMLLSIFVVTSFVLLLDRLYSVGQA